MEQWAVHTKQQTKDSNKEAIPFVIKRSHKTIVIRLYHWIIMKRSFG